MQHQADVLGIAVERGKTIETTALGAAYLAGLAVGVWRDKGALSGLWQLERRFEANWSEGERAEALRGWREAVSRARSGV
jgi:glycerol kinase